MAGFANPSSAFKKLYTTGPTGFAKVNGTPTLFTYNVPNDGNIHSIQVYGLVVITSGETGGQVQLLRNGTGLFNINQGGSGGPGMTGTSPALLTAQPGDTITIQQTSALTGGASTTYIELWSD
jgi:hypothetical protein